MRDEAVLRKLQVACVIGGAVVALHGITNRRWHQLHTLVATVSALTALALLAEGAA